MKKNQFFKKLFDHVKLGHILNPKTIFTLSKTDIKNQTQNFSKHQVLRFKKRLFAQITKKQPLSYDGYLQLKKAMINLGLRFHRQSRIILKNYYYQARFFWKPLPIISHHNFKLKNKEKLYLDEGEGKLSKIVNFFKFKPYKFDHLLITNQALVIVFDNSKNYKRFALTDHKFIVVNKLIMVKCWKYDKSLFFIKHNQFQNILNFIKHIQDKITNN